MGLFDKFKKVKKEETAFSDTSKHYEIEEDGSIFSWSKKPEGNFESEIKKYSKAYKENLPQIIEFMMPDIREMYGEVSKEEIQKKLGKPIIDYTKGTVTYCEQTFDDEHIFTFEFLGEFKVLQYFSIDG